jgi:hypothetical protein
VNGSSASVETKTLPQPDQIDLPPNTSNEVGLKLTVGDGVVGRGDGSEVGEAVGGLLAWSLVVGLTVVVGAEDTVGL